MSLRKSSPPCSMIHTIQAYSIQMITGGYNISQVPAHRADLLDDLTIDPSTTTRSFVHISRLIPGRWRVETGVSRVFRTIDMALIADIAYRLPVGSQAYHLSVHSSFLPFPKTSEPCLREFNKSAAQSPLMRAENAILKDPQGPEIDGRWRRKAAHKVKTKTTDEEEKDVYTNTMHYFRLHQRWRKGE